jgi:hypothetical protein
MNLLSSGFPSTDTEDIKGDSCAEKTVDGYLASASSLEDLRWYDHHQLSYTGQRQALKKYRIYHCHRYSIWDWQG